MTENLLPDLHSEAENILKEFTSQNFIKSESKILKSKENEIIEPVIFQITTLEDKTYKIELSRSGYQILESGQFYESFDTLLGQISPKYMSSFSNLLFSKLSEIKNE